MKVGKVKYEVRAHNIDKPDFVIGNFSSYKNASVFTQAYRNVNPEKDIYILQVDNEKTLDDMIPENN